MSLIAARGVVEFRAYALESDGMLVRPMAGSGAKGADWTSTQGFSWRRPVVALLQYERPERDPRFATDLYFEPLIADGMGEILAPRAYLEGVFGGGLHWDHCTHFYFPHVDDGVEDDPVFKFES